MWNLKYYLLIFVIVIVGNASAYASPETLPLKSTWSMLHGYPRPPYIVQSETSVEGIVQFDIETLSCSARFNDKIYNCELRSKIDLGFQFMAGTMVLSAFFNKADYMELVSTQLNLNTAPDSELQQTICNSLSNGLDIRFAALYPKSKTPTSSNPNIVVTTSSTDEMEGYRFGQCSIYNTARCVLQTSEVLSRPEY